MACTALHGAISNTAWCGVPRYQCRMRRVPPCAPLELVWQPYFPRDWRRMKEIEKKIKSFPP
jgi:hypothetical protein